MAECSVERFVASIFRCMLLQHGSAAAAAYGRHGSKHGVGVEHGIMLATG
jgi:hypothetical protein